MCKSKGCILPERILSRRCLCDYACFDCFAYELTTSPPSNYYYDYWNVRNKFVCFDCKHVWKSSISKYCYNFDTKKYLSVLIKN